MGKRDLILKSAWIQQKILKMANLSLGIVPDGCTVTQEMRYDMVSQTVKKDFEVYQDYTRYRTFELVAEEIRKQYTSDELNEFCIAEAGVYIGNFAWIINQMFPECDCYLYDTFDSFNTNDMEQELKQKYTDKMELDRLYKLFKTDDMDAEQKIELIKSRMKYKDKCIFRKGYFPDTIGDEKNKKWIFVSLDMDLYQPIYEGIKFFWPRLVVGGYMFIHDYNNSEFQGVKVAIDQAEQTFGRIARIPIADQGGTIILMKQ